jgi:hypothetical protein
MTKHSESQPKANPPTISSEPTEAVAPKRGSRRVSVAASSAPKEAPGNKPAFRPIAPKVGSGKASVAMPAAPERASRQKSIVAPDAPRQAPHEERLSTVTAPKKAPHKGPASRPTGWLTIGLDLGDRSNAFCVLDDDGAVVAPLRAPHPTGAQDYELRAAQVGPVRDCGGICEVRRPAPR